MILLLIFNFLLALVFILTKKISLIASPAFLTGIRFFTAGMIFNGLRYYFSSATLSFKEFLKINWQKLTLIGVSFALGDILRTQSLQIIPSSHASLLATSAPFLALIISYFLLNESITRRKIAGLLLGIIGLAPLLSKKIMTAHAPMTFITSYLLFMVSTSLIIIGGVYSRKLSAKGCDLLSSLAAFLSIAGIVSLFISAGTDKWSISFFKSITDNWILIFCCIVIQNIIGFYLYNYLIKYNPVTLVTFSNLLVPLFTSIILRFYKLETLEYEFFFGFGMLVIAFIVLMSFSTPSKVQNTN